MAQSPEELDVIQTAFSKAFGVLRMMEEHSRAIRVSAPEAMSIGRRLYDEARVDFASLDPAVNLEGVAQPTEEQIVAQYEQFKDALPESNTRNFGYRIPAAVKVEYLRVSRPSLEGAIKIARTVMGATNSAEAAPGTIRGDFGVSRSFNLVHGSDGPETAAFELGLFFPEGIVEWDQQRIRWLYDAKEELGKA